MCLSSELGLMPLVLFSSDWRAVARRESTSRNAESNSSRRSLNEAIVVMLSLPRFSASWEAMQLSAKKKYDGDVAGKLGSTQF